MPEIDDDGPDIIVPSFLEFQAPDLTAHYWVVAGMPDGHHREDIRETATQVFSSAAAAYVPVVDKVYQAWLAAGNAATAIDTEDNLNAVLMPHGMSTAGKFRLASGNALLTALTDGEAQMLKPRDLGRLTSRGADGLPEIGDFVVRVSGKVGTSPKVWFDAALGVGA